MAKLTWRRRLGISAIVVGVLALLGVIGSVLGLVWLRSAAGNAWIGRQVVALAPVVMTEGRLELDAVDTDLLTRVGIDGLVLYDDEDQVLLRAGRVDLSLDLWALTGGTVRAERATLTQVDTRLVLTDDGHLNLLDLLGITLTEPLPPLPVPVEVGEVRIMGRVDLDLLGYEAQVEDLDLQTGLYLYQSDILLREARIRGQLGQPLPTPFEVGADLAWDGQGADLTALSVRAGATSLGAVGAVSDVYGLGGTELTATMDPLSLVTASEALSLGLGGSFTGDVRVEGPWSDLRAGGLLTGPEGGTLDLQARVDLTADGLPWVVDVVAVDLPVHALVEDVPGPVVVGVSVHLDGQQLYPLDAITAQGTVEGQAQRALGLDFDSVHGDLALAAATLQVQDLVATGPLGESQVSGTVDLRQRTAQLRVDTEADLVALRTVGAPVALQGMGRLGADVSVATRGGLVLDAVGELSATDVVYSQDIRVQRFAGDVRASFAGEVLEVEVAGGLHEIGAYGARIERIDLPAVQGSWEPQGVLRLSGPAVARGLTLEEAARLDRAQARFSVHTTGQGTVSADVALSPTELEALGFQGVSLQGDAHLGGDLLGFDGLLFWQEVELGSAVGQLHLGSRQGQLSSVHPTFLEGWANEEPVTFELVDGGVRDLHAVISGPEGRVTLDGSMGLHEPLDAAIRAEAISVSLVQPLLHEDLPTLHGQVDFTGHLGGTADALVLSGGLGGHGLRAQGYTNELDVFGTLEAGDGQVVPDLVLLHQGTELGRVSGTVPFVLDVSGPWPDAEGELDLVLSVERGSVQRGLDALDPALLPDELEALIAGEMDAEVLVYGPMRSPQVDAGARVDLEVTNWSGPGSLVLDAHRRGPELSVHAEVLEGDEVRVVADGSATTRLDEVVGWALEGGDMPPLEDVTLWVDQPQGQAHLKALPLVSLVAPLDLGLAVGGRATGDFALYSEDTRLGVLGAGYITDGRLGQVHMERAHLHCMTDERGVVLAADLLFQPRQVRHGREVVQEQGGLEVRGSVPMAVDLATDWSTWFPGELDLLVRGPGVPVAVVTALDPSIDQARGLVEIQGRVGGPLLEPEPAVLVKLEEGGLYYPLLELGVDDLSLSAEANLEGARLHELRAWTHGGRRPPRRRPAEPSVRVGAGIALDGWSLGEVDGEVVLNKALIASRPSQEVRVSTPDRIRLGGRWPRVEVSGGVAVDHADVEVDPHLLIQTSILEGPPRVPDPVLQIHRTGEYPAVAEPEAGEPLWAPFVIDLDIDLGRQVSGGAVFPYLSDLGALGATASTITVQGSITGKLHVHMEDADPVLSGEVEVVSGEARVLNSRFEVRDGVVRFLDEDFLNPSVDVQAFMRVPSATVDMHVTGTPSKAAIDFTSDELASEDQMVFAILTGNNPQEMDPADAATSMGLALASLLIQQAIADVNLGALELRDGYATLGFKLPYGVQLKGKAAMGFAWEDDQFAVQAAWAPTSSLVGEVSIGDWTQEIGILWTKAY